MAAGALRIFKSVLFTNRKLPSIHSESVPRCRSKADTYRPAEKRNSNRGIKVGNDL